MEKALRVAVECGRQESVDAKGRRAKAPAARVTASLVQRIGAFEPDRLADPMPQFPHDDLTQIRGIGPRIAERLNLLGVARFEQIAAWTAIDVRRLSVILGLGRTISAQKWIEQAALLRGEAPALSQAETTEADAALSIVEAEVPQPASTKIRSAVGGLINALERLAASAPQTLGGREFGTEYETEPDCVTEQAAMPHLTVATCDFGLEEGIDQQSEVGHGPPPLSPPVPQVTLPVGFEHADEHEDEEQALRMIAALAAMPSLEPDCADLTMEESDIMTDEAQITIIERAPVEFGAEDDWGRCEEAQNEGLQLSRLHRGDEAPQINTVAHAGYYDDLDEATVEIFDVIEGEEANNSLIPQKQASARRKYFRALTGEGG